MSSAPNNQKKIGVVLLNMGGPDNLDNIRPFLVNLFSDREIIQLPGPFFLQKLIARSIAKNRSQKVRDRYQMIGGKTPQTDITFKQAAGLKAQLDQSGVGHTFATFVAMRYWHPLTETTVNEIVTENFDQIIVLPLYPQYCRATTGSGLNEFKRCVKKTKERERKSVV